MKKTYLTSSGKNISSRRLALFYVFNEGCNSEKNSSGRPRCLELCIKVMRKRPQRVGGTQNGKSGFDSLNSVRNMIGTLVLMCGSLMMSKLRILYSFWKRDFNLVGIPVWREIQITDMSYVRITTTSWIPCWSHFLLSWLLALFRASL